MGFGSSGHTLHSVSTCHAVCTQPYNFVGNFTYQTQKTRIEQACPVIHFSVVRVKNDPLKCLLEIILGTSYFGWFNKKKNSCKVILINKLLNNT